MILIGFGDIKFMACGHEAKITIWQVSPVLLGLTLEVSAPVKALVPLQHSNLDDSFNAKTNSSRLLEMSFGYMDCMSIKTNFMQNMRPAYLATGLKLQLNSI